MDRDGNEKNRDQSHSAGNQRRIIREIGFTPLEKRDLNDIVEIEQASFRYPWSLESFREVLDSRVFGSLAARDKDERLMGYIIFSEVVDELHILNVAVHPRYRNLGIATEMLKYLHQIAIDRKRTFAYLEVRESNKIAQQLYLKFGYKPIHRRRDYYSDNHEDAIVMTATLKREKKKR